jgi:hypothetical protein
MRKIYLKIELSVVVSAEDGVSAGDIMDNLDIPVYTDMDGVCVIDHETKSYEITDSK